MTAAYEGVVYRFYDADCRLLYVGCSSNLGARLAGHKSQTPFWKDVDTISVEHFDTHAAAQNAERAAIATEHPKYNIVHSTTRQVTERRPRTRREPEDRTSWPTEGLVVNSSFVEGWVAFDGSRPTMEDVAIRADVDLEWLMNIVNQRIAGNYADLHRLSNAMRSENGTVPSVEGMCPNRNPGWTYPVELETVAAPEYTRGAADAYFERTGKGRTPLEKYVPPGKRLLEDGRTLVSIEAQVSP